MSFQGQAIKTKRIFTNRVSAIRKKFLKAFPAYRAFNLVPHIKKAQEPQEKMTEKLQVFSGNVPDQEGYDILQ